MFAELGQLLVDEEDPTKLVLNPFTWTNISSSLYFEAPACVGYSYADTLEGCVHNDETTAADNLAALQAFFTNYSEYASNEFYITGESYAGIYVPTLAKAVYQSNIAGGTPQINLKGIAVGNGCLGNSVGTCAFGSATEVNSNIPYFFGHGLIPSSTYKAVLADCTDVNNPSSACSTDLDLAHQQVGNVNIYDIYAPCINGPSKLGTNMHSRAPVPIRQGSQGPIECIDETIAVYINSAPVRAALHVAPVNFAVCGSNSSFQYDRTEKDERVDVYPILIEQAKINVLIYNGEADACVPWVDNAFWTESMNYTVSTPWTAWSDVDSQVAGYYTGYATSGGNNFAFVTVKGAGHMVPQFKASQAWTMYRNFIQRKPFTS
jgi:serine carboxypeptidase-like clade I